MTNFISKLKWLRPKIVIGFGSKYTFVKTGINKHRDTDLIIVSDYFKKMSYGYRKKTIQKILGDNFDIVPLDNMEFNRIKKNKSSIVNIALNNGRVLYQDG